MTVPLSPSAAPSVPNSAPASLPQSNGTRPFEALRPWSSREAQLCLPVSELREALRGRPVIQALADKISRRLSAQAEDLSAGIISISPLAYAGPIPLGLLQAETRADFLRALVQTPMQLRDLWLRQALQADNLPGARELSGGLRMQLVSFNVWGLPSFGGLGGRGRSRYPRIAAELAKSSAGVIALQEMWDHRTTQIVHAAGFPYVSSGGALGKLRGNSGLVTLSRYPIVEQDFFPFTERPGLERAVTKGVLFTRVALDQDTALDIYNTHLVSGSYGVLGWFASAPVSHRARMSQLKELELWRQSHRTRGIPSVTVGDLNIDQADSSYAVLQSVLGLDAYRTRFPLDRYTRDSCIFSEPELVGATVDPCTNRWAKWKRHAPQRLDHIWLADVDPLRTALAVRRCFVEQPLSDHYGLELELFMMPHSPLG